MGELSPGRVFIPLFPAAVAAAGPIPGSDGWGVSFLHDSRCWLEWSREGGHKSHWLKSLKMED